MYAPDELPGEFYDAGLECSAHASAFSRLQKSLCHGGKLCVLSDGNLEPLVLDTAFHERELSAFASSDGGDYPGHARAFWTHWRETRAPLEDLFEWRVAASSLPEAFERAAAGPPPVKILISYR